MTGGCETCRSEDSHTGDTCVNSRSMRRVKTWLRPRLAHPASGTPTPVSVRLKFGRHKGTTQLTHSKTPETLASKCPDRAGEARYTFGREGQSKRRTEKVFKIFIMYTPLLTVSVTFNHQAGCSRPSRQAIQFLPLTFPVGRRRGYRETDSHRVGQVTRWKRHCLNSTRVSLHKHPGEPLKLFHSKQASGGTDKL